MAKEREAEREELERRVRTAEAANRDVSTELESVRASAASMGEDLRELQVQLKARAQEVEKLKGQLELKSKELSECAGACEEHRERSEFYARSLEVSRADLKDLQNKFQEGYDYIMEQERTISKLEAEREMLLENSLTKVASPQLTVPSSEPKQSRKGKPSSAGRRK